MNQEKILESVELLEKSLIEMAQAIIQAVTVLRNKEMNESERIKESLKFLVDEKDGDIHIVDGQIITDADIAETMPERCDYWAMTYYP